jgi:hypothetical protein
VSALPDDTLPNPFGQAGARYGGSVALVGNARNDGGEYVIVGVPYHDGPEMDEGAAMLLAGTSAGIAAMPVRTLDNPGDYAYGEFGTSVAGAGDVNGDGLSDWVVGAPGQAGQGKAFIYHGVSLTSLPSAPALTLNSPTGQLGADFGGAVSR